MFRCLASDFTNEKGRFGYPEATLRMVSGLVEPPTVPLSAKKITDNAPRGSSPTSLLNHETSDHLLSRLEAMPAISPGAKPAWTAGLC